MANVFDLGASFQRGYATGSQVVARREANKLAQQQAMIPPGGWIDASGLPNAIPPGAYTGDANALAQVAAHDPGKAYKLKTQYEKDQREGTQDDLAIEKTRLEIAEIKRESEQAAAEAAAKLSDAEKAAEERRIGGLVAGAREAYLDGPEAWEMFKQAYAGQIEASGMNPDALTYEMAPAAMAVAVGNLEGIKRAREFSSHFDPAEPEIKVIDGQIVQIGPDGASVMPIEGMQAPEPEPLSAAGKFFRDQNEGFIPPEQEYKPSGVTVNAGGPDETAFQKESGKLLAQEASKVVAEGAKAQRSLSSIDMLETALADSPQGFEGAVLSLAGDLGIKTEGSANIEVVTSLVNKLAPAQREPGSGDMSDRDVQMFLRTLPRLMNTPEGNQQIIDNMRAIAEYDVQRGLIARNLQLGRISQQEAADAYSALGNPLATAGPGDDLGAISPELEGVPKMYYDGLGDLDPRAIKSAWDMLTDQERALFE
jgi:hypothetical protein